MLDPALAQVAMEIAKEDQRKHDDNLSRVKERQFILEQLYNESPKTFEEFTRGKNMTPGFLNAGTAWGALIGAATMGATGLLTFAYERHRELLSLITAGIGAISGAMAGSSYHREKVQRKATTEFDNYLREFAAEQKAKIMHSPAASPEAVINSRAAALLSAKTR